MEKKEVKQLDTMLWQVRPLDMLLDNIEHVLKTYSIKQWYYRDSQYCMMLGTFLEALGLFATTKESIAVLKLFYETMDKGDDISKIKNRAEKLREYQKVAEEQVNKTEALRREIWAAHVRYKKVNPKEVVKNENKTT